MPQQRDVILARIIAGIIGQVFFGDQHVQIVVAQVIGDRHRLCLGFSGNHRPIGRIQGRIQTDSRASLTLGQRERLHQRIRQHRDFVARHVDGGHALLGDIVDRVAALDSQRGCGDMDADTNIAVCQPHDGECIVDFRGSHVIDRKGLHVSDRQARRRRDCDCRKSRPFREVFKQEFG